MYKHDFLGRELEVGDKVVWPNTYGGRKGGKDADAPAYFVGIITKLCPQQAKLNVLENPGWESKIFYECLIKVEET